MTTFETYDPDSGLYLPKRGPDQDSHQRLGQLDDLGLGGPAAVFDAFATTMAHDFAAQLPSDAGLPWAMINIFTTEQTFIGLYCPPDKTQVGRTMSLDRGFCRVVVRRRLPLVLADVCASSRYGSDPVVDELNIATYTGAPLIHHGSVLGTVCVLNTSPRPSSTNQQAQEFIVGRRDALIDSINQRPDLMTEATPRARATQTTRDQRQAHRG